MKTDNQHGIHRWSGGDVIVVQDVFNDTLWAARPVVVGEDVDDRRVWWCPKGTVRKVPVTPPSRPEAGTRGERLARSLAHGDWLFTDSAWDVSTLWLLREDDWHAVWLSFLESGEQWGWYINFQEPYRRTAHGIQTMDLALDMIVEPDRSSWRWKDEDEFELFIDRGLIRPEVAARVRQEAEMILGQAERDAYPFNSEWPRWSPDPCWPVPELPARWKLV